MSNITTQFSHIFIHYYSNRATSTSKLFISEPSQSQEKLKGRLFGILEINTPSRENSKIISQLINDLEESYYSQPDDLDIEKAFENTLKDVNQKFQQLIEEKRFYLVGNLDQNSIKEKINFTIGLIKDENIFFCYLNDIGLHLVHKGSQDYKLIDIKKLSPEEKDDQEEQAFNLFSNFISGQLKPGDYVFLANSIFLKYVSLERIRKTITSIPIHKAAEYFKNSLLQHEGNNFAAIIIKNHLPEKEDSTKKLASVTSITELNQTESSTEKLLSPSLINSLKTISSLAVKLFNKIKDNDKKKQKQLNQQADSEAAETVKPEHAQQREHENNTANPASSAQHQVQPPRQKFDFNKIINPAKNILKSIKIRAKKLLKNKKIQQNISENDNIQQTKQKLKLKFAYLGTFLKKIPLFSKILLFCALILIIIFIYSTSYFSQAQENQEEDLAYQNLLTQIEDKINQAKSNLIIGDNENTRAEITQAQELLPTLPIQSQKQKEQAEDLYKQINEIIAKLRNISAVNTELVADLNQEQENNINITNIVYKDNKIIAFDSINNNSYIINTANQEVNKIYSNLSDIGLIVKAKIINDNILIYHDKNGFITFSNNKFIPFEAGLLAEQEIADFSNYNNRLYTLDLKSNQIYRHPNLGQAFSQGSTWLKEPLDLSQVNSISIDTNIWLLQNDGKIIMLNKGLQHNFTVSNIEPPLESGTQMFTNDQTNYLYVLDPDNKRLIVFDKEGTLITQYYNDAWDNLKTMKIVEKDKKIYIVNDNKILYFNTNHL